MIYSFRYISIKHEHITISNEDWAVTTTTRCSFHLGCPGDLPDATSDAGKSPWPPQLHRKLEKHAYHYQGRIQDLKLGVAQMNWKIWKAGGGGGGIV